LRVLCCSSRYRSAIEQHTILLPFTSFILQAEEAAAADFDDEQANDYDYEDDYWGSDDDYDED
jgi:hypothetical protein